MLFHRFSNFQLEAVCRSAIGRVRKNNEDNILFSSFVLPQDNNGLDKPLYRPPHLLEGSEFYAVFDGMGGAADGEVASHIAAQVFKEKCKDADASHIHISEEWMEQVMHQLNKGVQEEAGARSNSMGTTAAIVGFAGRKAFISNVGDSRVYRLRDCNLEQLSIDHTDAHYLNRDTVTARKPALTQYIGVPEEELSIEPHIKALKTKRDDIFLLCSDGLTDMVSNRQIQSVMVQEKSLHTAAERLMELAMEAGGRDNISFIIVRVL